MRAVVCRRFDDIGAIRVEQLPEPQPGPRGVVIAVKAAGVNFPDLLMIEDKYQHKPGLPFVTGTEVAGVVERVGADVVEAAVGDHVVARVASGGHAEKVLVPDASRVYRVPTTLDFKLAAAFPAAYGTSLYALRHRAGLAAGETLLVLGASGGVGLAAVQVGKLMGARVIACAGSDAKLALAAANGADAGINYDAGDLRAAIRQAAGERGCDVVLDVVGGRYAEPAFREIAWGGRYLVVGFAAGEIPRLPINLALLKGASLVGVSLGGLVRHDKAIDRQCIADVADWIAAGRLKPHVSATYPLDEAVAAITAFKQRRVVGKILLVP